MATVATVALDRLRRSRASRPTRRSCGRVFLGFGLGAVFPLSLTLPVDVAVDPAEVGAVAALMLLGGYLISAVGPVLLGLVRDATGDFGASDVAPGRRSVSSSCWPVWRSARPDSRGVRSASSSGRGHGLTGRLPAGRTTDRAEPRAGPGHARYPCPVTAENDIPTLSNGDLARIFHDIGDMLEVKGELVFKTVAYHRAADAIAHSPVELVPAYRAGNPPKIAGVGQAISDKIDELARTGHLAFYDRLVAEVPPSLVELLRVPGVGPRTVKILYEELGIESLEELRRAAEAGRLRSVKGLSSQDRGVDPRGDRGARGARVADAPRGGRGAGRHADRGAAGHPGPRLDRAGRLVPPAARDDRRPRPPGRDERPGGSRRPVHRASARSTAS